MAEVSVLGAGLMGSALVAALVKAGHEVTVWNRTPAKAKKLEATGARAAGSLLDALGSDLVVCIVGDYAVSEEVLGRPEVGQALRGKTLLQLVTGTPSEARRNDAWAAKHGIRYLEGAIMATPDFIGQSNCLILYSGPREVFASHESTLRDIAGGGRHVGDEIGHANALDNAILAVLWGSVHGMLQGSAISEAESLSLGLFRETLQQCWPVVEPLLASSIDRIAQRRWAADATTQTTLGPCHASVRHVLAISREHGLDTSLPEAHHRVFQRAAEQGHSDDDVAVAYLGMR